jgi:hypothetical protein
MTDESAADTLDDDALRGLLDRPLTELSVDELMSMKAAYTARGIRIINGIPWEIVAPVVAGAAIYSKTFLETLAQHHAETLIDTMRARARKKDKTIAVLVRADDDEIAKFAVLGDLTEAARLALSDLHVTAEALCDEILWWDADAKVWRIGSADE